MPFKKDKSSAAASPPTWHVAAAAAATTPAIIGTARDDNKMDQMFELIKSSQNQILIQINMPMQGFKM